MSRANVRRGAWPSRAAGLLAVVVAACAIGSAAVAQDASLSGVQPTLDQLAGIRDHLTAFEDAADAVAAGYEPFGGCMSGPQGAQGQHYRNVAAIMDPALDPMMPELLMYEPREDGTLRLIGAEYIVFQQAWHDAGTAAAPALLGREFSLNTTLLDEPFYALHLWVWQYNPSGLFANWNPLVTCDHAVAAGAHTSAHRLAVGGTRSSAKVADWWNASH